MSFISFSFCIFFVVFIFLYHLISHLRKNTIFLQQILILISSLVFYAFADIRFLPFLLYVIIISYLGGIFCKNRTIFIILIIANILPLLFFKYAPMKFHSHIIFPLGISFFTFQGISYTVDCYKKKIIPERNFIIVALFISFFPVISSGPIQRADKIIPQFKTTHSFKYDDATDGLKQFAWGIFKKLCIADKIALYVNYVYGNVEEQYGIALLLATILYSFQIYCDFSGYSDMAIGIAKYMGFDVGKNFDHPYLSKSVSEFWHRWHISLSSWLRDYIYIPLGGSRVITPRIYINLLLTFLVSGIWHGSSWNFIIWGLLHGLYQCIGRATKTGFEKIKIPSCVKIIITFCLVSFAWIFFRAENFSQVGLIINKIAHTPSDFFQSSHSIKVIGIKQFAKSILALDSFGGTRNILDFIIMFFSFCVITIITRKKSGLELIRTKPLVLRWILYIILCSVLLSALVTNTNSEFLYFAF